MPEEFEGDLAGAVFWGADLSGARFRDVNLTDATISHAWLVNVDIDALVDKVVINGVDVTAYVNERDPWYPLRTMLRPADPTGMRATWAALETEWATTILRARALPEDALHASVNDEWSFVQTLRHLVFAMDKWFTAPILEGRFHPIGLPNTGSVDFPWPGLDYDVAPSVSEALDVRADGATRFRDYLAAVATTELTRSVEVLENGTNPLQECICTVFEEEFSHNRYARRDLTQLEVAQHDST
jgi:DinB superfamily/Pentapeptide repeats (8 copies)